jgi:hypothetical protein
LKPPQHFRGLIMAFAQQVQFRQWKFMFHSSSAFIYAQQKSIMAYTEKHRKHWKSATDHCPSCMRQRREPVWEHLLLMQSLLLVTIHGCKFSFFDSHNLLPILFCFSDMEKWCFAPVHSYSP